MTVRGIQTLHFFFICFYKYKIYVWTECGNRLYHWERINRGDSLHDLQITQGKSGVKVDEDFEVTVKGRWEQRTHF